MTQFHLKKEVEKAKNCKFTRKKNGEKQFNTHSNNSQIPSITKVTICPKIVQLKDGHKYFKIISFSLKFHT